MPADREYRRPESVLVVVYTTAHECLLLERVAPMGFWQSVTGALESGETPGDAAVREVREEIGLQPLGLRDAHVRRSFPIRPEWRARYAPDVELNIEHLWYLELPSIVTVKLDPREHRAYQWLPLAAAIERVSSWTNKAALEALWP